MSLITFTTDWGLNEYEASAMKGFILSKNPDHLFVDISHHIAEHNIMAAAYIFSASFSTFPADTVHFVGIEYNAPSVDTLLVSRVLNQWIVCYDNGFIDLIDPKPDEDQIYCIKTNQSVFPERKLLRAAMIAESLASDQKILDFGFKTKAYRRSMLGLPIVDNGMIKGVVIYVDGFGNAVTNIDKVLFDKEIGEKDFYLYANNSFTNSISFISHYYTDETADDGNLIAIFNDRKLLEISIKGGKASQLLYLKPNDRVIIELR